MTKKIQKVKINHRNPVAYQLYNDRKYLKKVEPNKKKRKQYKEVLKRMEREANEVMKGYLDQYE